jgi:putative nucleotidyltransferase with HDIG domain
VADASTSFDALKGPRADLARTIPRRSRVKWWMGLLFAVVFAGFLTPAIHAERIFVALGGGHVAEGQAAKITVRVPPFAGYDTVAGHIGGGGGGGVVIARGEVAKRDDAARVLAISDAMPHGGFPYFATFALAAVLAGLFAHHMRRSNYGRLVRVQLTSLGLIAVAAGAVKLAMLTTAASLLVVPVALFAIVPTIALDRVVGLATGTLAALVMSLLVPFDVGIAILLLVQVGTAGLVVAERPKSRWRSTLVGGAVATIFTTLTYPLFMYLTTGALPLAELHDPAHSAWIACAIGPAIATIAAVPLVAPYQLLVGEITHGKLVELEDLSHPLLRQIAERAPGTWQHSLMMANMAELAANAIGANGRLVRVGAYYHDLGKSLSPKYFIENLEPGETSPHDKLPPESSCDAIFAHVTEGIVTARRAGLHERIVDFMHMHHGNGVLEYFWAKAKDQGSPRTIDHFRYPGVPPQSRETAILAICDAVEAASRTLKKPDPAAIDQLVNRIVYGKLHLGQLDDSGLSMADLRRVSDSLRETIRHANHGRIEYPWQKAQQDASASVAALEPLTQTGPRLDSLDRPAIVTPVPAPLPKRDSQEALANTDAQTPKLRVGKPSESQTGIEATAPATPPALADAHDAGRSRPDSKRLKIDVSTAQHDLEERIALAIEKKPTLELPPKSPEAAQFAAEAKEVLREASKEMLAVPREVREDGATIHGSTPAPVMEPTSAARKRAATLPPTPLALLRRPPTMPPSEPKHTIPGPLLPRPPAAISPIDLPGVPKFTSTVTGLPPSPPPAIPSDAAITLPPVPARRLPAMLLDDDANQRVTAERTAAAPPEDAGVTAPRMRASDDDIDATSPLPREDIELGASGPGLVRVPDDLSIGDTTSPSIDLPLRAPESNPAMPAQSSWRTGLSGRLESALDDDFGTETPVVAPTKAELQALLNSPPEVTREQSLDELERLHRAARNYPDPGADLLTRRAPFPTAEVDEADIEAAIEIAPPARRTAIGVVKTTKKKPEKK